MRVSFKTATGSFPSLPPPFGRVVSLRAVRTLKGTPGHSRSVSLSIFCDGLVDVACFVELEVWRLDKAH
jgi:hypothetical protein